MHKPAAWLALPLALALLVPGNAEAQRRPSTKDRLAALEQQANAPSPALELLRQIEDLRAEVQGLRAQIEELQHQNQETARSARNQYLDLDTRLQQLEAANQPPPIDMDSLPAGEPAPAAGNDGAPPPATPAERAAYDAALNALKAGEYVEAARGFSDFLAAYPRGAYAPNAVYWLGESYYVTENYALAQEQFQALVQRWPVHDKAPGALLKLGLSQIGLRQESEGRRTLQAVVEQYPGSDAARTAQQRLRSGG
ncbi:tol-pal system protein YbgF [Luteimonas sp. e5]